jgi:hypothetical protein
VRKWVGTDSMFAHVLVPIDLSERGTRCLRIVETLPVRGQGLATTSFKVALACACPVLFVK